MLLIKQADILDPFYSIFICILEQVRIRMQQPGSPWSSAAACLRATVLREGSFSLFRGVSYPLATISVQAIAFPCNVLHHAPQVGNVVSAWQARGLSREGERHRQAFSVETGKTAGDVTKLPQNVFIMLCL